jgi:hypothetical protein
VLLAQVLRFAFEFMDVVTESFLTS